MLRRVLLAGLVLSGLLAPASSLSAATTYADRVTGVEVPPITSTLGTFVGAAAGRLPGRWRVQITHQPLRSGPSVAITGGNFTMHPIGRKKFTSSVTGGTVTVVKPGTGCTDQVYTVHATLKVGSFTGRLTHHRHTMLGRCVIYAATITGRAILAP